MGSKFMGAVLLGWSWWCLRLILLQAVHGDGEPSGPDISGTIAFATVGRVNFAFDVYALTLPPGFGTASALVLGSSGNSLKEIRLTDGNSVNYNGILTSLSESVGLKEGLSIEEHVDADLFAYVSERDGSPQIYFNTFHAGRDNDLEERSNIKDAPSGGRRLTREKQRESGPVGLNVVIGDHSPAMYDKPCIAGDRVVYMSTKDPIDIPRQSWTAVFSTLMKTGETNRLTPAGVTDYSPAVSPSGKWVMVASQQGRVWDGNRHDLSTDLYAASTVDGAKRHLVVKNGGWPSWADDRTVFFHRQAEDGWWSVYRISFSDICIAEEPVAERVTPPGVHAFTPAASRTGKWIAVATRRPGSPHRHIEIFDLKTKEFVKLTEISNPSADHYNPFVSPDSKTVGYHRCRGNKVETNASPPSKPHVEHINSIVSRNLEVIRIDGAFPSFSPDGSMIVYIDGVHGNVPGAFVMNLDGTGSRRVFHGAAFGTVWDKTRRGTIYASVGPTFASEDSTVHIVRVDNADVADVDADEKSAPWKILTKKGSANNAFPSSSPDGKLLVFRSGRSGFKNLYIMDAVNGEGKYLRRLTEGEWDDTMASWSPDNEWIAFASDRDNPGSGSFALYFVRPDGTGLHKVLNSTCKGRINHPNFSPDSESIVFTSDLAGQSVDPISVPNQFQPYGEIFIANIDGSRVQRLTHNGYEDGTPSWGAKYIEQSNLSKAGSKVDCGFNDINWLSTDSSAVGGPSNMWGFLKCIIVDACIRVPLVKSSMSWDGWS